MKASELPAWAAATMDCSLSKWGGILGRLGFSRAGGYSPIAIHPWYTDGPIRKKSHGSEEFLWSYPYQLEDLAKGTI